MARRTQQTAGYKVGDTIELDGPSNMVRLPDNTVVTCRGSYTARHVGKHTVFAAKDGDVKEVASYDVADSKAKAPEGGDAA